MPNLNKGRSRAGWDRSQGSQESALRPEPGAGAAPGKQLSPRPSDSAAVRGATMLQGFAKLEEARPKAATPTDTRSFP